MHLSSLESKFLISLKKYTNTPYIFCFFKRLNKAYLYPMQSILHENIHAKKHKHLKLIKFLNKLKFFKKKYKLAFRIKNQKMFKFLYFYNLKIQEQKVKLYKKMALKTNKFNLQHFNFKQILALKKKLVPFKLKT